MNSCRSLLLCSAMLATFSASAHASDPPNVILIVADDLGYGELGCYGQQWIHTPHIDRLAEEGMRFTQFYSGNAVCAPSRCCLLTGKHAGHAYVRDNGNPDYTKHLKEQMGWEFPGQHPIPDSEVTLGEVLQAKGYKTAAIGKWGLGHVGTTGEPNRQGFDLFYGFYWQVHAHNHYPRFLWRNSRKESLPGNDRTLYGQTYSQDKFTGNALRFIRENKDKPFFLYLPFTIPHLAIQAPEESLAQYRDKIPEEEYVHKGYIKHPHPRAGYAAMVSHMDRDVGKIMALIAELKLDARTIVLFTSDNGPTYNRLGGSDSDFFQSKRNLRGYKGSLYEGGIRAPLVVRWSGKIAAGTVTDHISAFWDILPTLAQAAGAEVPANVDGISMLPTLLGQGEQKQHDYLYWEFPGYGGQQAVRKGRYKAVRQNMRRRNNPDPLRIELYDLSADESETNDLANKHPEVVQQMAQIMNQAHTLSDLFPLYPQERMQKAE